MEPTRRFGIECNLVLNGKPWGSTPKTKKSKTKTLTPGGDEPDGPEISHDEGRYFARLSNLVENSLVRVAVSAQCKGYALATAVLHTMTGGRPSVPAKLRQLGSSVTSVTVAWDVEDDDESTRCEVRYGNREGLIIKKDPSRASPWYATLDDCAPNTCVPKNRLTSTKASA